ncbi:transcription factor Ouib isoform X2 [Drosophila ficusphila]|uniref:transcription factor Ouib isoform X2 n=1 Tax=Drosophila ficusphila TaxID=30025 RepID=UPI0007E697ED|nr:transcription factor Ouib isoform X2 [Drosophila ficusphila]
MNATNLPTVLIKCRICLGDSEEDTMSSLFEEESESENTLSGKVEFCCGIKVRQSSEMPSKACKSCSEFVSMWFNFRQMCLNSQVYLETNLPCSERPAELAQASDGEFMEYLYEKLQLNSSPDSTYQEENNQMTDEEPVLEEQPQEVLDVNGVIISEQINEEDGPVNDIPKQMFDLTSYEAYFPEADEETIEDFSTQEEKRKPGRPRKPDSELKFQRKGSNKKRKVEEKFTCNLCGNVYYKRSLFTAHMISHTEYKPHQCEICPKSFRQLGELRAHIRRHTGERPYKCMYCERHFYDRSERLRHERMHTNTRPYACQECGKTFTHTATLKNHTLVHSGEKNYNCDICSKSFTLLHQLKAHLQTFTHRSKMEVAISKSPDLIQS